MSTSITETTPRLLRLSISLYRNPKITGEEGHDFARNNHAVKAAPMHANHGIKSYVQGSFLLPCLPGITNDQSVFHTYQVPQGTRGDEQPSQPRLGH